MPLTRFHATVFLGPPASYALEEPRRAWDPGMARQIARRKPRWDRTYRWS